MAESNDDAYEQLETAAREHRVSDAQNLILAISFNSSDLERDHEVMLKHASSPEWGIRGTALMGIAHLARIHRRLPDDRSIRAITIGLRDAEPFVRSHAYSAADDIAQFVPALRSQAQELLQVAEKEPKPAKR